MRKTDKKYTTFIQILEQELVAAMGCTEPIAIAYAAAKAREILEDEPERVTILVSNNLIKNAKSVVVPNTNGLKGIEVAVAAGIIAGDSAKELEVISKVSVEKKEAISAYLTTCDFEIEPIETERTFEMHLILYKGDDYVKVQMMDYHTNIVFVEKNNEVLLDRREEPLSFSEKEIVADKSLLSVEAIVDFAKSVAIEEIRSIIEPQIACNVAIAEEGLKENYGANIGSTMMHAYGDSLRNRAIAKAAAGSDARMSGCELPVIINSGSGNQGITVAVPVIEYARELGSSEEQLYRALVLSNLLAIHVKAGIGRLSAYCGVVSAGSAAGCGIAYLHGGGLKEISHTLVNSLAILSGTICDGAKPSCAAKIASSVEAGILGYHMYMNGQQFRAGDGIVAKGVEENVKNVTRLGREGMKETDKEIVKIMIGC